MSYLDDFDLARLALKQGNYAHGLRHVNQALGLPGRTGEFERGPLLVLRGQMLWGLARFDEAIADAQEALQHCERQLALPCQSDAHLLLSIAYGDLGLHDQALIEATTGFSLAMQHRLTLQEAMAMNRLGLCYLRLGDCTLGESFLLNSLSLMRECSESHEIVATLNNLGMAACGSYERSVEDGDPHIAQLALDRARRYVSQAINMARREGHQFRVLSSENNLAKLMGQAGETVQAERLLRNCIARAVEHSYAALERRARYNLGCLLIAQDQTQQGIDELRVLLADLIDKSAMEPLRRVTHAALRDAYKKLGMPVQATDHEQQFSALEARRVQALDDARIRLAVSRLVMDQALAVAEKVRSAIDMRLLWSAEEVLDKVQQRIEAINTAT